MVGLRSASQSSHLDELWCHRRHLLRRSRQATAPEAAGPGSGPPALLPNLRPGRWHPDFRPSSARAFALEACMLAVIARVRRNLLHAELRTSPVVVTVVGIRPRERSTDRLRRWCRAARAQALSGGLGLGPSFRVRARAPEELCRAERGVSGISGGSVLGFRCMSPVDTCGCQLLAARWSACSLDACVLTCRLRRGASCLASARGLHDGGSGRVRQLVLAVPSLSGAVPFPLGSGRQSQHLCTRWRHTLADHRKVHASAQDHIEEHKVLSAPIVIET